MSFGEKPMTLVTTSEASHAKLLVETSAIVAIILEESDWRELTAKIESARCLTTSINVFEAVLALAKTRGTPNLAHNVTQKFLEESGIEIVAVTPEMIPHAVHARERYGRGRNALNMGDCLSYGAAKHLGLALLYKGDDFAATDIND
jgi:ribonuclease VapC